MPKTTKGTPVPRCCCCCGTWSFSSSTGRCSLRRPSLWSRSLSSCMPTWASHVEAYSLVRIYRIWIDYSIPTVLAISITNRYFGEFLSQ
uniref:Uncharacterized protein n=1 Tax=Globisporangium ultimum (strain ATCC 200006 / CBS 805.95 / DAOM BR144) TaxID=431595 RepID=K3X8M0_GLOUD